MTDTTTALPASFEGLGIAPTLMNLLTKLSYTVPTPIQHQSIPVAIAGNDVIGIAQTGTGKTLAFGIPMIQRLAQFKGRGLVILPTRELALQVEESLKRFGTGIGMKTAVLIGGASMHMQKNALKLNPHVIIATPGRLIDHLEQRTINLHDVKILVLDEADRMLDMGFAPQIAKILTSVPKERQTMLFSATMPLEIVRIANSHMKSPVRVEVAPAGTSSQLVEQEMFFIAKHDKERMLEHLLKTTEGTVLVFSRTKHGAKKIARGVTAMGFTVDELHSNRSLAQRKAALEGFKSGRHRVLVATDIAARGIDVKAIALVVNYDLPDNPDDYVHRIGRTGRAGHNGKAVSFATPDQRGDVKSIERIMRKIVPLKQLPRDLPPARNLPPMPMDDDKHSRGTGRETHYASSSRKPYGSSNRGSAPAYAPVPMGKHSAKRYDRADSAPARPPMTGNPRRLDSAPATAGIATAQNLSSAPAGYWKTSAPRKFKK